MAVAAKLINAIKRTLKTRGLTYAWLAPKLEISESTVKRLLSRGQMSLERFDGMCAALNLDLHELLKLAGEPGDTIRALTLEQEQALADSPTALGIFYMLLNGWSTERAAAECGLSASAMIRVLTQLDRIKVLDLLPHNRVRLRVPKDHLWLSDGPLRNRYREEALQEFFRSRFSGADDYLRFEIGLLGSAGIDQFKRSIDRIAREFNELTDQGARLPHDATIQPIAVVLAYRGWDFKWILRQAERRRRPASNKEAR